MSRRQPHGSCPMLLAPEKKSDYEASSLARSSAPTLFAQKLQEQEGLSKTEVKEGGVTFSLEPTPPKRIFSPAAATISSSSRTTATLQLEASRRFPSAATSRGSRRSHHRHRCRQRRWWGAIPPPLLASIPWARIGMDGGRDSANGGRGRRGQAL